MKYTVHVSHSGVAHVYLGDEKFCSVHNLYAGGIEEAKDRAEMLAKMLNDAEGKNAG